MATKEDRQVARGLIEALESRVHQGPPILETELRSAQDFLRQNAFAPASEYFDRLLQVQTRLQTRVQTPLTQPVARPTKRNYGGAAAERWMQVQSAYDHVILSTCYEGELNQKSGRVKISHRFNQAGRIDFVELKFLRSLHPCLDGAIRHLVSIRDYQTIRKDWHAASAFVLPVLPKELVFLFEDIFRSPRHELVAWLINIGHWIAGELLTELNGHPVNGHGHSVPGHNGQLSLEALRADEVAWPILGAAAGLESAVDLNDAKTAVVRYVSQ
jgi:hypothetical protein